MGGRMNFKINLSEIKIDGGTQSRVAIDQQVVADYAEAYKVGIRFPDISLFFDGSTYWLVDGFHRYHAAKAAGKTSISAEKRDGTQREAVLYACGANSDHGLRRSNEDKRKAVLTLLADDEWKAWSNVKISEACAVSASLVDRIRHEAASSHGGKIEPVRTVKRGGKIYTQNTANVGKQKADDENPEAEEEGPTPDLMGDEESAEADAEVARENEEKARGEAKLAEILTGDDPLAAMTRKCKELTAMNAVLNSRLNGLMSENSTLKKMVKNLQRKAA